MKHITKYTVNEIEACLCLADIKYDKLSKGNLLKLLNDEIELGNAPTIESVIDDTHEYLKRWYRDDRITDFEIAHDSGFDVICRYLMISTGVIEENTPVEKAILKLSPSLEEFQNACEECFKGCVVMTNPSTNETWWIPGANSGVDYFVNEEECIKMGYSEKSFFLI